MIAGILFIVDLPLLLTLGPPPATGEQAVTLVAGQSLLFRTAIGIFIAAGMLFIPAVIALYLALKELDKNSALVATGLAGIAIPVYLGATIMNYSLTGVKDAAVAQFVLNAVAVGNVVSIIIFSISILILAMIMRKGVFGRNMAYLGTLTGVVGIIGSIPVAILGLVGLVSVILFAIWFLALGSKLYRLGRSAPGA